MGIFHTKREFYQIDKFSKQVYTEENGKGWMAMKRILAIGLALFMMLCAGAWAEGDANRLVVNCEEWVSLRAQPDTSAERLVEVPLGAVVTECTQVDGKFVECAYAGQTGYILAEYLMPLSIEGADLSFEANGLTWIGTRFYAQSREAMRLICMDEAETIRWSEWLQADYATELSCTDAFLAGTAEDPLVMTYIAGKGLSAREPETGEVRWTIPVEDIGNGASLSVAVADDGTMYIGGYYGPDPVAVSMDGEVLWQSSSGSESVYWLHEIELTDEGVVATYDCIDDNQTPGKACYGYDGALLWIRAD